MASRIPTSLIDTPLVDSSLFTPGGRLTIVSGQPVMPQNADHSSQTLYYAPFISDQVPLFDGSSWGMYDFVTDALDNVGLSMIGGAVWTANSQRDVFVVNDGGAPVLCTGPAWPTEDTASRSLTRRNGRWVNSAQMTCDVSASSQIVVPANRATWLGSINIGAVAGTLTATFTLGQNRRCDVWNAYNQLEILLGVGCPDPAGGTTIVQWKPDNQYPAWKAFNNDINNSGYYFTGLPQQVECRYLQRGFVDSLNFGYCAAIALVCKDTIDNGVGTWMSMSSDTLTDAFGFSSQAVFIDRGTVGAHRAIMGTANANSTDGSTLWGLAYGVGRALEDAHVMWITYRG